VLFLEEEIRSGGAGMNLSDKLKAFLDAKRISHAILAIDDSFVANTEKGRSIYESAGIDAKSIKKQIKGIL
jgi:deoxyxylulose-5-phosphate synthase